MSKVATQCAHRSLGKLVSDGKLVKAEGYLTIPAKIKSKISSLTHKDDPDQILKDAENKLSKLDYESYETNSEDPIFKAMTLREFENGTLMTLALVDQYKTFGIDLMRKIQAEYECSSPSEKAAAELAAISFVRVLDIQRRMRNYLEIGSITGIGVQYIATLSKEIDRAQNQYMSVIQTLRSMKLPPMQLNVKANMAVVGQNQVVQAVNKPI